MVHHLDSFAERRRDRRVIHIASHSVFSLCICALVFARSSWNFFEKTLIKPELAFGSTSTFDMLSSIYDHVDSKLYPVSSQQQKYRPSKLRFRNDAGLFNTVTDYIGHNSRRVLRPLLADQRPSFDWHSSNSSSSSDVSGPSLEDIELIDVLWRRDIDFEKGSGSLGVGAAEQYELDLQLLTEKSIHQPLSTEERRAFEGLSRGYFDGFYNDKRTNQWQEAADASVQGLKCHELKCWAEKGDYPICGAVKNEASGIVEPPSMRAPLLLNATFCASENPVLNNIWLSQAAPFNATNATESVVAPVYVAIPEEQSQIEQSSPSLCGSAVTPSVDIPSPTLALDDSESDFWFLDAQVRNDVSQCFMDRDVMHEVSSTQFRAQTTTCSVLHQYSPTLDRENRELPCCSSGSGVENTHCDFSTSPSANRERWFVSKEAHMRPPVLQTRTYGKLFPIVGHTLPDYTLSGNRERWLSRSVRDVERSGERHGTGRRRGRQSKDDMLVAEFNLPASAAEISDMSLSDFQKLLRLDSLDEEQRSLIRKIRRRGKNKVAARTCRQRRSEIAGCAVDAEALPGKQPIAIARRRFFKLS